MCRSSSIYERNSVTFPTSSSPLAEDYIETFCYPALVVFHITYEADDRQPRIGHGRGRLMRRTLLLYGRGRWKAPLGVVRLAVGREHLNMHWLDDLIGLERGRAKWLTQICLEAIS